jgi:predicted outer membrane repeat protein
LIQPDKTSLGINDMVIIKVLYKNNTIGINSGSLQINSNDKNNSNYTINLSASTSTGTTVYAGDVWGTWTKTNSPYFIMGNIKIEDSAHLNIQSGVNVIFEGNYTLTVWGVLNAKGILGDTIVFKRDETDTIGYSNPNITDGGWGIIFWDSWGNSHMWDNDSSVLEYCKFKFGKAFGNYPNDDGGVVNSTFSRLRFTHCEFENNSAKNKGGAMYFYGGANIDHSTFTHNQAYQGGVIYSDYTSILNLNNCVFQWNRTVSSNNCCAYAGAIYLYTNKSNIQNNLFANNFSAASGGAVIFDYSNDFFGNNVVANNNAAEQGGAIVLRNANPVFVNNTIINNNALYGGGIAFWQASASEFYNNIIWGNTVNGVDPNQMVIWNAQTNPIFENCIIHKDSVYGAGFVVGHNAVFRDTISSDPLIKALTVNTDYATNVSSSNWNLKLTSPAINKGIQNANVKLLISKDFYNQNRIMNGFIDIGASETYIGKITLHDTIKKSISLNADTVEVTANVVINQGVDLIIPPGTKVLFDGQYYIKNFGAIIAIGTKDNKILFSKIDTLGFYNNSSNNGGWEGIHIDNDQGGANGLMTNEDSCKFENCIFEFAKNTWWDFSLYPYYGGAVNISYYSKVSIKYCDFRYNTGIQGGGLYITDISNPVIMYCRFYNNLSLMNGGGLGVDIKSSPIIENNLFTNNKSLNNGGGVYLNSENSIFINNIIYNNYTVNQGGGIAMFSTNPIFSNNTVINNYAKFQGGGLIAYNSPVAIYNSVFWNNNVGTLSGQSGAKEILNSNANFYNCNIRNYLNNPVWGDYFSWAWLDSSGLISSNPNILKLDTNGLISDFHINQFSGNIDKGMLNIPGVNFPSTDFYGNPRINNNKIDIGAVENQGGKLIFIKQPSGRSLCNGDSISLTVEISDTALYKWQKDGVPINGANKKKIVLQNVTDTINGNYFCVAQNAYGTTFSNPVFFEVKSSPSIIDVPPSELILKGSSYAYTVTIDGQKPFNFQWTLDGKIIKDSTSTLSIDSFTRNNEGNYICKVSNICGSISTTSATLSEVPEICMVSVLDTAASSKNAHNLIVWDKESKVKYAKYNIYRETSTSGFYDLIGSVPYSSPGLFVDNLVNPRDQAYLYKITAVDLNNKETDINLCPIHKTIHLLTTYGVSGGIQLDWDQYIGFNYGTYYIFRGINRQQFKLVHQISSSIRSWTDFDTIIGPKDTLNYYIAVQKSGGCNPYNTNTKSGDGLLVESVSNMEDNRLRSYDSTTNVVSKKSSEINLSVYPNPFNNRASITYYLEKENRVIIKLYDTYGNLIGKLINEKQYTGMHSTTIDPNSLNLKLGVYIMEIK